MTYPPQPQVFGHSARSTSLPQATPAAPRAPTAPATPAASTPTRVVEAHGLTKVHDEGKARVIALDSVSLVVGCGGFMAIMDPFGSDKSILLHCPTNLDTPTSDSVLIAGQDLPGMEDKQFTTARRNHLGFIFQSFNLLPTLSTEENILLLQRLAHHEPQWDWYDAVISALGIGDCLSRRPHELPGGQQQRVVVARTLVGRPEAVFADEPIGALDTVSVVNLLRILTHMYQTLGQTVVMVTHGERATATTSRTIRPRDGHIARVEAVHRPVGTRVAGSDAHHIAVPSSATGPVPRTEVR